MLDSIVRQALKTVHYLSAHPQFVITLILVLVIPIAFVYTGERFLTVARDNQDRLEKDKIGVLHDTFIALAAAAQADPAVLQNAIRDIVNENPDIVKFRVVADTTEGFSVIAAVREDIIGAIEPDPEPYRMALINPNDSFIYPYEREAARHWQAFRAFSVNETQYFLLTETSFRQTDQLFAGRIRDAYLWLFGVLAIVMVLAYRHLRLIDYQYLYTRARRDIEARDRFTNVVTHELRAPLTAMRGYASMIRENDSVEYSTREQAGRIEDSAARLLLIINDLLEVARLQSGRMHIEKAPVDVCRLITDALDSLQSEASEKHIKLLHDFKRTPCELVTDAKRLTQVVVNLANNAIKYTEKGHITVVLEDRGSELELRVEDTGMGIKASDQRQLFAPFFRVSSGEVDEITGSGLGMWITKQLVELLGGTIGVESIKDVGTHVVVTLPKT